MKDADGFSFRDAYARQAGRAGAADRDEQELALGEQSHFPAPLQLRLPGARPFLVAERSVNRRSAGALKGHEQEDHQHRSEHQVKLSPRGARRAPVL